MLATTACSDTCNMHLRSSTTAAVSAVLLYSTTCLPGISLQTHTHTFARVWEIGSRVRCCYRCTAVHPVNLQECLIVRTYIYIYIHDIIAVLLLCTRDLLKSAGVLEFSLRVQTEGRTWCRLLRNTISPSCSAALLYMQLTASTESTGNI